MRWCIRNVTLRARAGITAPGSNNGDPFKCLSLVHRVPEGKENPRFLVCRTTLGTF